MECNIKLARNDVIGKLAGSRALCSLENFNEQCTAVIVKKVTDTSSFCTLLILFSELLSTCRPLFTFL